MINEFPAKQTKWSEQEKKKRTRENNSNQKWNEKQTPAKIMAQTLAERSYTKQTECERMKKGSWIPTIQSQQSIASTGRQIYPRCFCITATTTAWQMKLLIDAFSLNKAANRTDFAIREKTLSRWTISCWIVLVWKQNKPFVHFQHISHKLHTLKL